MDDNHPRIRRRSPSRGAVSGSGNEAGGDYRAGVAAWFAALGLAGRDIEGLGLRPGQAIPRLVTLEVDDPVDDIRVRFSGALGLLQAKRDLTLGSEQFRHTVEQWVRAFRSQTLDRSRDRLVLATESDSALIVALRDALQRRRTTDAGAPTQVEHEALEKLTDLLTERGIADPDDIELVLDVSAVLRVEITEPNARHRSLAEEVLSERVVTDDDGPRAFEDLKAAARLAAIRRHGRVMREWLDALEDAGRTLRDAADGSPSARAAYRKHLVQAYRGRIEARGSEIDLRALGVAIAPVRVPFVVDAWEVVISGEGDRATTRHLGPALERRGRMILLGAPGAGKSSALLQLAAAWASQDDQLVPIVVQLQRFLSEPMPTSLTDLVRIGLEVPRDDRALIDELVERLKSGEAALLLDGLDETRHRRFELISALDRITDDLDPGADCVLTTRDVAYAEARTLGWPTVRLAPVTHMEEVLRAIGAELAQSAGVPEVDRREWIDARLDRLADLRRGHPMLGETPLLNVLAFVLLAQRDVTTVPSSRARILSDLIDEQIERKEVTARGAAERWTRNTPEDVGGLLRDSFFFIGHRLFDRSEIPRDELVAGLTSLLQSRWQFGAGEAEATADRLLNLWDEGAVFVASGNPPAVSGRIRGLIEVAEARYAAELRGSDVYDWIGSLASDAAGAETLILAAGLSSSVARSLVEFACARPLDRVLLTAAEAVERGADVSPDGLASLVDALLQRVREAPSIAAAKSLATLPVPDDRRGEVQEALEGLKDERLRATAVALAVVRWGISTDDNAAVLRRVLVTRPPGGLLVDEGWGEAVVGAVERLLAEGLRCDDEIVEAYRHASLAVAEDLDAALARAGRLDLKRRAEEIWYQPLSYTGILRTLETRDRTWGAMLRHLADRDAVDLSAEQARRLSELGDLMQTFIPGEMPSTWMSHAERNVALLLHVIDLAIVLGRFDAGILAAQAPLAAAMSPLKASIFLHDTATARPLENWAAVDVFETRNKLLDLMRQGPLFAWVAAEALQHAPDRDEIASRVVGLIPDLDVDSRHLASQLSLALQPSLANVWLTAADPVLTRTAADAVGRAWVAGNTDEATLRVALLSGDAGVRSATIKAISEAGGKVAREILDALDRHPATNWQCMRCQRVNAVDIDSCARCRIVGLLDIGPQSTLRSTVSNP